MVNYYVRVYGGDIIDSKQIKMAEEENKKYEEPLRFFMKSMSIDIDN